MVPGSFNLALQRGASYCVDLPVRNKDGSAWDLTGYTAHLRIYDREYNVVLTVDAVQGAPDPNMTVHASKTLTLDDGTEITTGAVELTFTPSTTETVCDQDDATPLNWQLDLLDTNAKTHRLLRGEVTRHRGLKSVP